MKANKFNGFTKEQLAEQRRYIVEQIYWNYNHRYDVIAVALEVGLAELDKRIDQLKKTA